VPICVKTDVNSKRYVNCVLEDEVKPAINLLKAIKPELNRRALKNKCDNNRAKPYMTENDTVEYVTANFAIKDKARVTTDLNNLEVLSFFNPSWGVSVLQVQEDGVTFIESAIAADMVS
jgi:hypothetical protein